MPTLVPTVNTHDTISHIGMFGMRNFWYRFTGKIIPILSVYWLLERKIPYCSGNLKETLYMIILRFALQGKCFRVRV